MMNPRLSPSAFSSFIALSVLACSAPPGKGGADGGSSEGDSRDASGVVLPDGVEEAQLLPARVRRLTNAEYDSAVQALLDTQQTPAVDFPPDARQHGYSVNEAQRVDPVLARALDRAAMTLAEEAVTRVDDLAPCDDKESQGRTCAAAFAEDFATRAYRRPLSEEERTGLLTLYDAATQGEGADTAASAAQAYEDGVALIIRGVLQSPGFLYVTETGGVEPEGNVRMTPHEIASALAFLVTGGPPDEPLLAATDGDALTEPDVREQHLMRLLGTGGGLARSVEVVRQWLGIDRILVTDKDATVYPEFSALREAMARETEDFVVASLVNTGGAVTELLAGPATPEDSALADLYGGSGPERRGLLNQGAFLSVYAHAHETGPVLRGTAVMRRVACIDIEIPTSLNIEIVPPAPDPTLTTRERFSVHTQDPECATCHELIDPLGFAFEQFDGMGAFRSEENGTAVDSSATVALGRDFDGSYEGSIQLAAALSASADVGDCFARQVFRAQAAEAQGIEESEDAFVADWRESSGSATFVEVLVALVRSDLFVLRRNP